MSSSKTDARIAGGLYLLSGVPAAFSNFYVPSLLYVHGDATATARNIAQHALLFRMSLVADVLGQILFVVMGVLMYKLLEHVGRGRARLMLVLVVIGASLYFAADINLTVPMILLSGASFLSAFTNAQLDALSMAFLRVHSSGVYVVQVFWGLWLLPFGALVVRSRFLPAFLGRLLWLACLAYVTSSVAYFLSPAHEPAVSHLMQPLGGLCELAMMVWLVVRGVTETQTPDLGPGPDRPAAAHTG